MKLRKSICLWILAGLLLIGGYLAIRREYMKLHDRYEALLVEAEVQSDGSKNEEAENTGGLLPGIGTDDDRYVIGKRDEADRSRKVQADEENFYYVTLCRNEIIAYTGDHRQICMRTRIEEADLAAVLLQELRQGIYLENLPALYEYLENCSS